MGLSSDAQNYGLRMRRVCRERFPRQSPRISDPDMHVRDAHAVMHAGIAN